MTKPITPEKTKKNWFDDWIITKNYELSKIKNVRVSIPYSSGNAHNVSFRSITDARVMWLIDVLDCALTELSQKDTECERRVQATRKDLIAEFVRWMRMENSVAVVHQEEWNEFIKSLTTKKENV